MTDSKLILKQDVTSLNAATKKREKVGEFEAYVPNLTDFIEAIQTAKQTGVDSEAMPVYDNNAANWLFGAIVAKVKGQARNALQSGTAILKAGHEIAMDFNALVTPSVSQGSTALAQYAEVARLFVGWMEATGKPAGIHASLAQLVRQRSSIALQGEKVRQVLANWLTEFATEAAGNGAIDEFQQGYIVSLIEACSNEAEQSLEDMLAGF